MRALLALVLVAAPAHAELERVDPELAPDDAALAGNALVWVDAKLYLDPVDTAPSVQLAKPIKRKDAVGQVMPVRVVASDKGFVQIEPTKDIDCTWSKLASHKHLAKLRLWVKRSDLAPVLAKPYRKAWKDGTKLALAVGTPLGRSSSGYIVSLHGELVGVAVPAASVAYAYKPGKVAAVKSRGKKPVWLEKKSVTLGEQTIQLSDLWSAPAAQIRGDRVLFPLEARCMTAVVSAAKSDVDRGLRGFGIGVGGVGGEPGGKIGMEHWYVPKGATLTSATGTATVAVTTIAIEVPNPGKATTVCIERPIDLDQTVAEAPNTTETSIADRTLKLCVPASVIQHDRGSQPLP
jgi:hypothetical protein